MVSANDLNTIDILCALFGVFILSKLLQVRKGKGTLPPGPKGYPLIGNVLDIPSKKQWTIFSKWGDQYGEICSITVIGQTIVILNSVQKAKEMLEKKSLVYSDRPVLQMAGKLVGWGDSLGFLPYGNRFRRFRRLLHDVMGSKASMQQFQVFHIEEIQTHRFLRRVRSNPGDLLQHIRHLAGAIITQIVYGYEVQENNDPFVELANKAMSQLSALLKPGGYVVDALPQLRHLPSWFPGAGFQREAKEWSATLTEAANQPFDFVKRRLAAGTLPTSFVSSLLVGKDVSPKEEHDIKWSALSIYTGGSDTTVSAIYAFFLAMALFPEVMRKAQAEIDSIIGNDRLPTFEDREHLPYIDALTKEVFRWNVVAPLGLPHRLTEDDVHDGYFIPKGTTVIVNIRRILYDPEVYANPHRFDPERFIATAGHAPEPDPRNVSFGFGRRVCPGLHLADASVFISCAMSLAVFDIAKSVENGVLIEPVHDSMTDGIVSHPKSYKCSIKPRFQKAVLLIEAEES